MYEVEKGKVKVQDIEMAYAISGKGCPLVLIMGFAGLGDYWGWNFVSLLAEHFRVILFDNRGLGNTTRGEEPFSIPRFADDTAGLMDALSIKSAHVMGWSMGSFIAQELALNFPERVNRLILYAGSCGGLQAALPSPQVLKDMFDISRSTMELTERALELMIPEKWLNENQSFRKGFLARPLSVYRENPHEVKEQARAILTWEGSYGRLKAIHQKTLLLTGTEDVMVPSENSDILAERIPDSRIERIAGGGHGMIYQYPGRISRLVTDFLIENYRKGNPVCQDRSSPV
ncbi:MAG: alpha/beta hydrolase [Synergistales bacterium]|nr:alpha/beta hydrolase [Synergistales bacterium]